MSRPSPSRRVRQIFGALLLAIGLALVLIYFAQIDQSGAAIDPTAIADLATSIVAAPPTSTIDPAIGNAGHVAEWDGATWSPINIGASAVTAVGVAELVEEIFQEIALAVVQVEIHDQVAYQVVL